MFQTSTEVSLYSILKKKKPTFRPGNTENTALPVNKLCTIRHNCIHVVLIDYAISVEDC